MDPAVIGALSALGGTALGGGLSFILERYRDARQWERDALQRAHDKRERRYEDRRSLYTNFLTALSGAERATFEHEQTHGVMPGDTMDEEDWRTLDESLAALKLLAAGDTAQSAENCVNAFHRWTYRGKSYTALHEETQRLIELIRRDLDADTP